MKGDNNSGIAQLPSLGGGMQIACVCTLDDFPLWGGMQIALVRLATSISGKGMQIARVRTLGKFTEEKSESVCVNLSSG